MRLQPQWRNNLRQLQGSHIHIHIFITLSAGLLITLLTNSHSRAETVDESKRRPAEN